MNTVNKASAGTGQGDNLKKSTDGTGPLTGLVRGVLAQTEEAKRCHEAAADNRPPPGRRKARPLRAFMCCLLLTWRDRLGLAVVYATSYNGQSRGFRGGAAELARLLGGHENHWHRLIRKWADLGIVTVRRVGKEPTRRIFPVVKTPPAFWELCRPHYHDRNGHGWGPGGQAVPPTLASPGFWPSWLLCGSNGQAKALPEPAFETDAGEAESGAREPQEWRQGTTYKQEQSFPTGSFQRAPAPPAARGTNRPLNALACPDGQAGDNGDSEADATTTAGQAGKRSAAALAVLMVMAGYADQKKGEPFEVSRRTLCRRLRMRPAGVQAALAELVDAGEVALRRDNGKYGRWWQVPHACRRPGRRQGQGNGEGQKATADAKGKPARQPQQNGRPTAPKAHGRRPGPGVRLDGRDSADRRSKMLQQYATHKRLEAAGRAAGGDGDEHANIARAVRGLFEHVATPKKASAVLVAVGMEPTVAKATVKEHGPELVKANGLLLAERLEGPRPISSLPGFLVRAIAGNWAAEPAAAGDRRTTASASPSGPVDEGHGDGSKPATATPLDELVITATTWAAVIQADGRTADALGRLDAVFDGDVAVATADLPPPVGVVAKILVEAGAGMTAAAMAARMAWTELMAAA